MKRRNHFTIVVVYLLVIAAAFSLATARMHAQDEEDAPYTPVKPGTTPSLEPPETRPSLPMPEAAPAPLNPRFTLSTSRAYSTNERARVWVSYQDLDALDFRVYQIDDPMEFFKHLDDLHQMGREEVDEAGDIAKIANRQLSFLERIHKFKFSVYQMAKRYVRKQLRRKSRVTFNDRFRTGDHIPLNVANYTQVPLLNSGELAIRDAWRQTLAPLNGEYESRMIPLEKRGPGVYLIEAVHSSQEGDLRAYTISVITDLTMIYKTAPNGEMVIYLADRNSGEPRGDAEIEIVRNKGAIVTGATDRNGIFRTRLPKVVTGREIEAPNPIPSYQPQNMFVMAERDNQFAISDLGHGNLGGIFDDVASTGRLQSFVYTDRPLYRPGQKAYFKGIVRGMSETGYEMPGERTVEVMITNMAGELIFMKQLPLTPRGTFFGEVDLASDAPTGDCTITARIGKGYATADFWIDKYEKPDFKTRLTTLKKYVPAGERTTFKVEARKYSGAPLVNARVNYYIYRLPYRHLWNEELDDSILLGAGGEDEAEEDGDDEEGGGVRYGYGADMVKSGETRLDMRGQIEIPFEVPKDDPEQSSDFKYRIEVGVTDASRYRAEAKTSIVGTRGNIAAHVESVNKVVYVGDQARIKVKTADYEGRPVSTKVTLKFIERKWERVETESEGKARSDEFEQRENELGAGEVTTDARGEALFSWRVPVTGNLEIVAILREGGRESSFPGEELWGAGRGDARADFGAVQGGMIQLVPDKKFYQPGETARVMAVLPTNGAHLLVTTEMHSLIDAWRVDATGQAVMIDVPIDRRHSPNVYLNVCYVKNGEMYMADKDLAVPARDKLLKLEIEPPDQQIYKPGDTASYTVVAKNPDDTPAAGVEISLGVVDDAIYGIRRDNTGSLLRRFYGHQYKRVETFFSTNYNFTGYSGTKEFRLARDKRPYQLADFKNENEIAQVKIRKEFKDTAFWQPDLITDGEGRATVKFKLPDNQTSWRATVRAVTADMKVGTKVVRRVSRNPLMITLETPRNISEGDTATISGTISNYDVSDKTAQVEIQVTGATLLDPARRTVNVAKGGAQRVDWRISATQSGNARLLAVVKTKTESDGVLAPLPIVPSGSKQTKGEALAIGEESGERSFTLDLPAESQVQSRRLRLAVAPSVAGALFGALDYLRGNRYGGTEQIVSSLLPGMMIERLATEGKIAPFRALNELDVNMRQGTYRLFPLQRKDGGWGWWADDKTDLFMTAYAVDALGMAQHAGQPNYSGMIARGRKKIGAVPLSRETRFRLDWGHSI